MRYRNSTIILRLTHAGLTLRLRTLEAEPWLEHSLSREDIMRGSITVDDVRKLERYVAEMEAPQMEAPLRASQFLTGAAA